MCLTLTNLISYNHTDANLQLHNHKPFEVQVLITLLLGINEQIYNNTNNNNANNNNSNNNNKK